MHAVRHFMEQTSSSLAFTASLDPSQAQDIIRMLLPTIPRYVDSRSRQAVTAVLQALLTKAPQGDDGQANGTERPANLLPGMAKWLDSETKKLERTGSPSTRFSVLNWACTIFSVAAKDENAHSAQFPSIATSLASLVYVLLDETESIKPALRKSVLTLTRRAVRNVGARQS